MTLLDLQKLRGSEQSWTAVHPGLNAELRSIDVFLGPASAH